MLELWKDNIPGFDPVINQNPPSITPYIVNTQKEHGAVIVCPGGGYHMKAPHEGEPIARWLNSIGLSAFVLDYRVFPYKHPYPMMDAQRAVRYVRYYASKWNINPHCIGILGFSAGGHLASTVGTHFGIEDEHAVDPIDRVSARPDAMILCYPVISFGDHRHHGSMCALIGEESQQILRDSLSNELQVTKETPPTFLWHTADDDVVPVENSLLFAEALSKNNISYSMHIFPQGPHGLGLAEQCSDIRLWTLLCEKWFRTIGFINNDQY